MFGLRFDLSKIFWKVLVIVTSFLFFKGRTHAYLVQISIIHNKILNPLLNLLINCTSARSVPQILSINSERTFRFSNFRINGLCNSSANSLLDII